jgi:ArsR family transcriptional regulator
MSQRLPSEVLTLIAERFRALGEPARLQILDALRDGEKTVTDLQAETGLKQANLSKHLQVLYALGFVDRRKEGLNVYYRLADDGILQLCHLMCDRLRLETDRRRAVLERLTAEGVA